MGTQRRYRRPIEPKAAVAEGLKPTPPDRGDGWPAWLADLAGRHRLQWLLAHADDGVIWGRMEEGRLVTSAEAARGDAEAEPICPPLRPETLQQARLFGDAGEFMLWRDGDNRWRARLIREARAGEPPAWEEAYDEPQLLWGSEARPLEHDFTLVWEGAQGLRHAVPLPPPSRGKMDGIRPCLVVRHYLSRERRARVVASRLLRLEWRESDGKPVT